MRTKQGAESGFMLVTKTVLRIVWVQPGRAFFRKYKVMSCPGR